MSTGVSVRTESADSYGFAWEADLTEEEVLEKLKEELGEEFDYICDYSISYSKDDKK